jgi:uncharacterized protein (TIGR02466 family)
MELHHWFPSVVGKVYDPSWVDSLRTLTQPIFQEANINQSFYHNGRTTYGTRNLTERPEFAPFINWVQGLARDFLDKQGFDADAVNWRPYFFANHFEQGSTHPKHVHTQCSISGIYYIDTPPGSADIVFYPNQPFREFFDYLYAVKDTNNWYSMSNTRYQAQSGLLLLWPSWLYHEVPPNGSVAPRTSVVFNL